MSDRSFHSVFMVASCAAAALVCYMVSLRVASERAQLESVETRIVLAQRDVRVLQTEIGTRGRLSQLERWNAGAFALGAPSADQFLRGGFELARLAQPEQKANFQAPVVLASAPAPEKTGVGQPGLDDYNSSPVASRGMLLHQASLRTETREVPARPAVELPSTAARPADRPAAAATPALSSSAAKPGLAAAQPARRNDPRQAGDPNAKNSVDKPALGASKAVTKAIRIAKVDPLAPLPARHSGNTRETAADR